jgi:hypothetical protein
VVKDWRMYLVVVTGIVAKDGGIFG